MLREHAYRLSTKRRALCSALAGGQQANKPWVRNGLSAFSNNFFCRDRRQDCLARLLAREQRQLRAICSALCSLPQERCPQRPIPANIVCANIVSNIVCGFKHCLVGLTVTCCRRDVAYKQKLREITLFCPLVLGSVTLVKQNRNTVAVNNQHVTKVAIRLRTLMRLWVDSCLLN